jgi:hypothetical protein
MMEGIIALGPLSQNGFSTPVSFLENVFLKFLTVITLAKAIIGKICFDDFIIVRDPTFHFTG